MGPCPEGMEGGDRRDRRRGGFTTSMGPCPEGMEGSAGRCRLTAVPRTSMGPCPEGMEGILPWFGKLVDS